MTRLADRWRAVGLPVTFAVLLMGLLAPLVAILHPPTSPPGHPDAVAVLYGSSDESLRRAVEIAREGSASVLLVSNGLGTWHLANEICRGDYPFEVVCPRPDPFDTRGEARVIGRLAAARRWRSVVVVTSAAHVARSRLLIERCMPGDVRMVGTPILQKKVSAVIHEWLGLALASYVRRSC